MSAVLPHLEITPQRPHWLAGAPGLEPGNGGIKIRCLTTWLRPIGRHAGRRIARTIAAGLAPINARALSDADRMRRFRAVDPPSARARLARQSPFAVVLRSVLSFVIIRAPP